MRLTKLIPALAGAATLLAAVPAGVSARHLAPSKSSGTNCNVALEAPSLITAGESATIVGHVSCPAAATAEGQQVTLFARALRPGVHAVTSLVPVTVQSGAFSTTVSPTSNTLYYAVLGGRRSAHKAIKVAPLVTVTQAPAQTTPLVTSRARNRSLAKYVFKGNVTPFEPGELVALQLENSNANEEWHRIALGTVNAQGEYTIAHSFGVAGNANLRVVAHPRKALVAGASTALSYVIDEPQNPQLKILASADPITFGETLKIEGEAAGMTGKTVTLEAHAPGSPFAPVSTTEAKGSSGAYVFSGVPTKNTAYRVVDPVTRSAVIYEGVKYKLTPTVSPITVAAGQPITFQGLVEPGPAGHPIYLERQNGSGISFHVVEVGAVTPVGPTSGSYSLTHTFYAPGVVKLRVKIPGDPQNQGVASAVVSVNVTPAPASTFKPVPPVKLPTEGQF